MKKWIFLFAFVSFCTMNLHAQAHEGDFNCDGISNILDRLIFLSEFGDTCTTPCVSDMNCDGIVNTPDRLAYLAHEGQFACPADYDDNDTIDAADFAIFLDFFSSDCMMADWNCDGQVNTHDLLNFPFGSTCSAVRTSPLANNAIETGWFEQHSAPILIAPNPVQGPVTIASVAGFLDADAILEVIGTDGRVVAVGPADRMELDMRHQPAGVYVVRASLGSWSQTAKLIKVD